MLISPPFLLPRQADETDDAWIDRCMQGGESGNGAFPVSLNLGWHGGMHLTAPTNGAQPEPVRAISDGTVVFVRAPVPQPSGPLPPEHPQAYLGRWTDNGVVVLRHDTEIGEGLHGQVTFYSIYMHLAAVHPAVQAGRTVNRKVELGFAGQIYGHAHQLHLEIICDDANLRALMGRTAADLQTATDGRLDAVYGQMYFVLPDRTQFFGQKPLDHLTAPHMQPPKPRPNAPWPPVQPLQPVYTSAPDEPLIVALRYAGGDGPQAQRGDATLSTLRMDGASLGESLPEEDAEYNLYKRANEISDAHPADGRPAPSAVYELLRFGRIVNTANETLTPATVPHWREVRYPGGQGWVNLNAPDVRKFSDADFPHWQQWRLIDDSADQDSRCDSATLRGWLDTSGDGQVDPIEVTARLVDGTLATKLARTICKFPTEWHASTVDQRWSWLKTRTDENPNPFSEADFALLRAHIQALAFFPGGTGLPESHWHFHPREFIRHFRRCSWLSASELARIYPDSQYPVRTLSTVGRTPQGIRSAYLCEVNRAASKYFLHSAARRAHFFGQGAVESMLLSLMVEGTASFERNPGHASFASEDDGYYNPPAGGYLDYLNGRLGNIEAGDGPKFRGRGMKQLTGRENYSKYWVYRGWLDRTSFTSPWWNPARPNRAPAIPDPQRLSVSNYNAIDAGGWYWEAGSVANRFRSINMVIGEAAITDETIERVTRAINGGINGLPARITHTRRIAPVVNDEAP